MHRVDSDGAVSELFTAGDPDIGQPGTKIDAAWLNAVQEELVSLVVAAGLTLVKGDHDQVLTALRTKSWQALAGFTTGWTPSTGGQEPAGYLDLAGVAHLRGVIARDPGTAGSLMVSAAGLPAPLRPVGANVVASAHYYDGSVWHPTSCLITTAGSISVYGLGASDDELWLTGISYPVS